jgi:hypothetical protein
MQRRETPIQAGYAQAAVVVLGLMGSLLAAGPARAASLPDPLSQQAAFEAPPNDVRPGMRWWWQTPYALKEFPSEIGFLADAGFGLAEVGFNADGFANQEQRDALNVSLEAARARGLRVDVTMGPGWPLANAAVAAETGLSQQELDYGRRDLAGPTTYSGPVPSVRPAAPCTATSNPLQGCGGPGAAGKLIAVTAGRVLSYGNPANQPPTQTNADAAAQAVASPTVLDPESLVDLTKNVDASGNIAWQVPAGNWILFAFYQRPSGQEVMDHLRAESARALVGYLDKEVIGSAGDRIKGVGGQFFEDSLELVTTCLWTGRMREEFRERRGYDLTKYLPLIFVPGFYVVPVPQDPPVAEYDLPDGLGARVRHDFWQTLDDLWADNHIAPFQRWAETHGMSYRAQAGYASTFHVTRAARDMALAGATADHESRNAGDPQPYTDRTWHFAFDNYRELAAGAHQGGSSDTAIELGATNARDYMVMLGEYKAIMDKAWAAGINRPVIHGLVYQNEGAQWPGSSRFGGVVAESWNPRTFPEWKLWGPLAAYWARGNLVLRQGRPQVDVAIYRDAFTTWQASYGDIALDVPDDGVSPGLPGDPLHNPDGSRPVDNAVGANTPRPFFDTTALEQRGLRLEYIDPQGLIAREAGTGAVLYPDGPSYEAVVIDERALPAEAAEAIERRAQKGLAVVFVGDLPSRGASARDARNEDDRVRAAVRGILGTPSGARVKRQADVGEALEDLGVQPSARWSRPQPVYSQHRRTATADYFYLWNAGSTTARFTAILDTDGAGHSLDLWSGAVEPLATYAAEDDGVHVPMTLEPGETQVVAFRRDEQRPHLSGLSAGDAIIRGSEAEIRDTRGGEVLATPAGGTPREVTIPDLPAPLSPEAWRLHVEESNPEGDAPKDVELTALADWRNIPELSGSSGTGTYTTTLQVPSEMVGDDRGAYLELGRVEGAIQVFLNGRRITPAAIAPRRIDLGDELKPGSNELRIVLATSLKNRIVHLAQQGRPYGGAAAGQPATQPYGVIGPVRIVPYGRATITLSRTGIARTCTSRRRITVHLRRPRGFTPKDALVRIGASTRAVRARRAGRRIAVVVDLRKLPKGTTRVRVRVRGTRGRPLVTTRTYRLCTRRKSR